MKWIITENYEQMSQTALNALLGHALATPYRVNMAITAGSTPKRLYELMVPGVTIAELEKSFFIPAEIPEKRIHRLDSENYRDQDQSILEAGGLDVILLGIGADGHYCGNLPNTTSFGDGTCAVDCDNEMKIRIGRHFTEASDIPDFYVTMGPRSIMSAQNLILFASGRSKAGIMKTLWDKKVDPAIPATLLTLHPSISIILDKEAASGLL